MSSKPIGVIAAGHPQTVGAAEEMLRDGGNAFDAVVAAHLTACIAEPVLSSLAGGGFLLAQTSAGERRLYDFFAQTPLSRRPPDELEFYPIHADFGETKQEFHIGMGAFATPGTVKGLYAIHRDLCTMPMKRLIEPAVRHARFGIAMNSFQAYIIDVVGPVFRSSKAAMKRYASQHGEKQLMSEGEILKLPDFADFLEHLAREGEDLFYRGEVARLVDYASRENGGHVTRDDFEAYELLRRKPLQIRYRGSGLAINPAPSSGGTLIAFALELMKEIKPHKRPFGSAEHVLSLAGVQQQTDAARLDFWLNHNMAAPGERMLDPEYMKAFQRQIKNNPRFYRGTTHMSVMDNRGNTASLTTSNGEGCGRLIPGTGIMMNNMLGEEDLHPGGFGGWEENKRISSMMAPAILNRSDGTVIALGSGGSNRLRTAILQVLLNMTDYNMSLHDAVCRPRIHCEKDFLSIEHGFDEESLKPVLDAYPAHKIWSGSNLFFGGAHSVAFGPDGFQGAGDPRRGGVSTVVR